MVFEVLTLGYQFAFFYIKVFLLFFFHLNYCLTPLSVCLIPLVTTLHLKCFIYHTNTLNIVSCFEYTEELLYLLIELFLFYIAILVLVWRHRSESVFEGGGSVAGIMQKVHCMVNSSSGVSQDRVASCCLVLTSDQSGLSGMIQILKTYQRRWRTTNNSKTSSYKFFHWYVLCCGCM